MAVRVRPPTWFWLLAIVLVVWEAIGFYACVQQFRLGADAMGAATPYDHKLYSSLPVWYNWAFLVGTFAGLLGGLALLLRERRAMVLFWISLIGIVVVFGYFFLATDVVKVRGAATVVPFPVLILVIGVLSIWFATLARRKGWLG